MRTAVVALALGTAAEACVQAHNYMDNDWKLPDSMAMEVYVDGHVVCRGGEADPFASDQTEFCLRNHDGKGEGCAPGYVYCVTNNGNSGYIAYYGVPPFPSSSPPFDIIPCCRNSVG